jgi:hypothetical protein
MKKFIKWVGILLGGALAVALAVGFVAFKFTTNARASTPAFQNNIVGNMNFRGGPGFPGVGGNGEQALADALGISLADLQTAQQKASDAAIQQAVKDGLITQDQADAMILRGGNFGFGFEGRIPFGFKNNNNSNTIDYNALLAQALNITTDQLNTAMQKAQSNLLDQAVANGTLTQAQADLIKARQALQSYIDPNALFAQALGISTDQLQTYRDQSMSLSQILSQVGKTAIEVRDAEQAAYQAAVQKAVSDGVITQAQADQVLSEGYRGLGGFGPGPGFGGFEGHGRGGRGGFDGFGRGGFGWPNKAPNTTPNNAPTPTPSGGA